MTLLAAGILASAPRSALCRLATADADGRPWASSGKHSRMRSLLRQPVAMLGIRTLGRPQRW